MASQLVCLFFICLLSITKAQSQQSNSTTGYTLYTNSTPSFWPSPSGRFAFGFYRIQYGFYKVGIWLVGVPKNIIVWTAQRDEVAVSVGASLLFSATDGRLRLRSPLGQTESITDNIQGASSASMLDSGNFVLYDSNFNIVWDSFDYPTDTILVGQRLLPGKFLSSSVSEADQSTGKFMLRLQYDGNLVACPIRSQQTNVRYCYWTYTGNRERNVSLNLDEDGRLYLLNSSRFSIKNITESRFNTSQTFLYRSTLDVDGILRLYLHYMGINGSSNVSLVWSAMNGDDRCKVKGICGLNSYCAFDDSKLTCHCPPGFVFVDPNQTSKGCKVNFTLGVDCFSNEVKAIHNMSTLVNTRWEEEEYEIWSPTSEEGCEKVCSEDCNCVVATFRDQTCCKLKLPLRYGRKSINESMRTFIKIGPSGSLTPNGTLVVDKITKKPEKKILIVGVVLVTLSLVISVFSGYLIYLHQNMRYKPIEKHASPSDLIEEINLRSFTYEELIEATDNFKEEIGKGASGKVYKGSLANINGGKEIAVKKLKKVIEEGETEFRNEMKIIGRTHHKNLVRLLGFCSERSNRLLVYEYMKNGSLGDFLFKSQTRPNWTDRVRISLEIARGIQYLHDECETRIIHCDIKPYNILMDESCSVKISDFGLSKLLKPDQTRTYTTPRGTRGYEAPEWHKNAPITMKADVYSYGIVLFEIICCRRKLELSVPDEEIILMDWVYECYETGELGKLVGTEEVEAVALERMVKVGLWCVQMEPTLRPSMKKAMLMLEGTVQTPPPPSPYSSGN